MKQFILLCLSIFILQISYAQEVEDRKPNVEYDIDIEENVEYQDVLPSDFPNTQVDLSIIHGFRIPTAAVRSLEEINDKDNVDAYPWLSPNGLHIYFTKMSDGKEHIFTASRNSIDAPFNSPVQLDLSSGIDDKDELKKNDIVSCWLTNDQLHIFFIIRIERNNNALFHGTRNNLNEDFSNMKRVELNEEGIGYLSAPSFTQDLSQLYIYNSPNVAAGAPERVLVFEQNTDNDYSLVSVISAPDGFGLGAGQLSKNGLKYHMSMKSEGRVWLFEMSRENINDDFGAPQLFDDQTNSETYRNTQPSFSADGNLMAFVRTIENTWEDTELYIAQFDTKEKKSRDISAGKLTLYPNPAIDYLNLSFDYGFDKIVIYSVDGKVLMHETLNEVTEQHSLDVSSLPNGIYICTLEKCYVSSGNVKFMIAR